MHNREITMCVCSSRLIPKLPQVWEHPTVLQHCTTYHNVQAILRLHVTFKPTGRRQIVSQTPSVKRKRKIRRQSWI